MKKLKLLATLSLFFFLGSVCLIAQTDQRLLKTPKKIVNSAKEPTVSQKIKILDDKEAKLLQQPMTDEIADMLEDIQQERTELTAKVSSEQVVAKKTIGKQNVKKILGSAATSFEGSKQYALEKAAQINKDFANGEAKAKAKVIEVQGKYYVQLVSPNQDKIVDIQFNN